MKKILLSKNKINELRRELDRLEWKNADRNKEEIVRGGSYDSWHETASFMPTKKAQELRISQIREILKYAVPLDEKIHSDSAILGSWINLSSNEGKNLRYRIVHPIEADPLKSLISIDSPLGKDLLGRKIKDKIVLNDIQYTITQLS